MNNILGNHTLKSVAGVKARTSGPLTIPRYIQKIPKIIELTN